MKFKVSLIFLIIGTPLFGNQLFEDTSHLLFVTFVLGLRTSATFWNVNRAKNEILKAIKLHPMLDENNEAKNNLLEKHEYETEKCYEQTMSDLISGIGLCGLCFSFLNINARADKGIVADIDDWRSCVYTASILYADLMFAKNIVKMLLLKRQQDEELVLQRNNTI